MLEQGTDHLWLDATGLESFDSRFPTIAAAVRAIGLDPARDWLPIAPAAHYLSGGIVTDLHGASALPGLWACGEVGCSGVHGANRLASNSLLEGMVFAPRVIEVIDRGKHRAAPTGALGGRQIPLEHLEGDALVAPVSDDPVDEVRDQLQRAMTAGAGVVRTAGSLELARHSLAAAPGDTPAAHEVRN